jgi:hypothetical protein
MKLSTIVAALAAALVSASKLEVLTDSTFDAAIASGEPYFVKFYAPW